MTHSGEGICFVIMPFKEDLDPVLDAIREAVDRAGEGLQCVRLDDRRHAGRITDDLAQTLEKAQVCIADLSGMNPNVMWEVGFAMSREKPIIFLAQTTDNLPFDIRDFRVIPYDLPTARKSLPNAIILALKETSNIYQWHARPVGSGDELSREGPRPRLGALRISLSISLMALLAVSGLLWSSILDSRHAREQLSAMSTIKSRFQEAQKSLRRAQESLRACLPSRYIYHYQGDGGQCDGFFEKKDGAEWVERTPGGDGCTATEYHFNEVGQEGGWILISDPSRGYFVRLPVGGSGAAQLASSQTGPWGLLCVVERVDRP